MSDSQESLSPQPQPEAQVPIEQTPGLLNKLRLGRLATFCAGVEVPAVVASIATKDPIYAEMGAYFNTVAVGGTLFAAHQYFRNGDRTGKDNSLAGIFIKDKSTDVRED
jgi:hypothetical protein